LLVLIRVVCDSVVIPTTLPRRKDGGIIKYMENNRGCVGWMSLR
jgi:hypothetical protein